MTEKKKKLEEILNESFLDSAITGGLVGSIAGGAVSGLPFAVDTLYHNPRDVDTIGNSFGYTVSTAVPTLAGAGIGGVAGAGINTMRLGIRKLIAWNALRKLKAQAALPTASIKTHPARHRVPTKKTAALDPDFTKQLALSTLLGAGVGGTSGMLINRILGRKALDKRLALGGAGVGALIGLLAGRRNAWEAVKDRAHAQTINTAYETDEKGNIVYNYVDSRGYHVVTDDDEISRAATEGRFKASSDPSARYVRQWHIDNPESDDPKLVYDIVPAKGEIVAKPRVRSGIYIKSRPTPVLSSLLKGPLGTVIDDMPVINTAAHHVDGGIITQRPEILSYRDRKGKLHHILYAQNKDGSWGTTFTHTDAAKAEGDDMNWGFNTWQTKYWNIVGRNQENWRGDNQHIGLFKGHYNMPVRGVPLFDSTLEHPHQPYVWYDANGNLRDDDPKDQSITVDGEQIPVKNLSMYGFGATDDFIAMLSPEHAAEVQKNLTSSDEKKRRDARNAVRSHVIRMVSTSGDDLRNAANAIMQNAVDGLAPKYQVAWLPGMPIYNCSTGVTDSIDRAIELGLIQLDPQAPTLIGSSMSSRKIDGKHDPAYGALSKDIPAAPEAMFPDYWDFNTNTFKSQP